MPNIDAANALYKGLLAFADSSCGGIVVAAGIAPIILVSRADNMQSKFYSIALALAASN